MIKWFLNLFSKRKRIYFETGWKSQVMYNNRGFYDIKVGDKFEGCGCGQFFYDQTCTSINGDLVYGTTTLTVFRKEFIRPVNLPDNEMPYIKTWHNQWVYEEDMEPNKIYKDKYGVRVYKNGKDGKILQSN